MFTEHFENELRKYTIALLLAVAFFIGLSEYIFLRRGYYDLYIANKAFAGTSAVMLGIVFLIGPLSRLFDFADRSLELRKHIGVVAMWAALAHVVSSFFFLPDKFPIERFFTKGLTTTLFGLVATVGLLFVFIISRRSIMTWLTPRRWWPMQYWGLRFIFLFTALHVFVMKWEGWFTWYKKSGGPELVHPEWPGGGLLVGWFMVFVLLMRIGELFGRRIGRMVWYLMLIGLPTIYYVTFSLGGKL